MLPTADHGRTDAVPSLNLLVTPGDFFDRLTILCVKRRNISDPSKKLQLAQQIRSMAELSRLLTGFVVPPPIRNCVRELLSLHRDLWQVEDAIRELDALVFPLPAQLNPHLVGFVQLARQVYVLNTARSSLKHRIDTLCGHSPEIKEYTEFVA